MFTFKSGIHIPDNKEITKDSEIRVMPQPEKVYIPMLQHLGAECSPLVAPGDYVRAGQLIGKSDKPLSSNIYSSVSGTVAEIVAMQSPSGQNSKHVCIQNDFKDDKVCLEKLENPSGEEILQRVKEAGIVGMGGAAFPTHIKLNPPKDKVIDTLIINGAECEPYITCDYRIMVEYTKKLILGIKLIAKTLNVSNIFIGIEDNKPEAVNIIKKAGGINVAVLKSKYPQGAEKQLIYAVTKRIVPAGGLPMEIGCVVENVHTAYSIYQAVCEGIPSYERIMTVSGRAADKSGNYIVRTGTTYAYITDYCGLSAQPSKIISGGPMMGFSVFSTNIAVTKSTSSLLFLTEDEINTEKAGPCINCGRCSRACPMFLMPMFIDANTLTGDYKNAKKYGAVNCIECGCCSYVCPAKRPLVQSIRLAKRIIRERKI